MNVFGLYSVGSREAAEVADQGQEEGVTWSQGREDHPATWPSIPFVQPVPGADSAGEVRGMRLEWIARVMFKIFPTGSSNTSP